MQQKTEAIVSQDVCFQTITSALQPSAAAGTEEVVRLPPKRDKDMPIPNTIEDRSPTSAKTDTACSVLTCCCDSKKDTTAG